MLPSSFAFFIRFSGDEDETKDLLQEIFIRLARSPALLDQVTSPRSYLLRLAHRLAIDRFRRESTRERHETCAQAEQESSTLPPPSSSDLDWQQQTLSDALASLPSDQKAVVLLKIWEEMTFAEIAEVLGVSANTAATPLVVGTIKNSPKPKSGSTRAALPADSNAIGSPTANIPPP